MAFFVGLGLGFLIGAGGGGAKLAPGGKRAEEVSRKAEPAAQGEAPGEAAKEGASSKWR